MKTKHTYLLSACFLAVVVFILTTSAKTEQNLLPGIGNNDTGAFTWNNDSDNFPLIPVGRLVLTFYVVVPFQLRVIKKTLGFVFGSLPLF